MVRAASWVLVAQAGCSFSISAGTATEDGPPSDLAIVDVLVDDCQVWQAHRFDACMIPPPAGDVTLGTASPLVFDTSMQTLTDGNGVTIAITAADYSQAGGVVATVWSMGNFELAPNIELHVIGSKPLIIAAWGTLVVEGRIDAGSHRAGRTGAGANPVSCATHASGPGLGGESGTGGGGGGGGRGHGALGGDGDGNCGGAPGCYRTGGARGTAVAAPSIVVGGCPGGDSGAGGGSVAAGGPGGGALHLAARGALVIRGSVLAGGAGGGGDAHTDRSHGGGGGGSGGSIGLEAASLDVDGSLLAANGGGGGAGGLIASTGEPGADGAPGTNAASGGAATSGGTSGGQGSSMAVLDGGASNGGTPPGVPPNGGGGGGGGGAGFIQYWAPTYSSSNATVSPTPTPGS